MKKERYKGTQSYPENYQVGFRKFKVGGWGNRSGAEVRREDAGCVGRSGESQY
jgi:hypothetical protein